MLEQIKTTTDNLNTTIELDLELNKVLPMVMRI